METSDTLVGCWELTTYNRELGHAGIALAAETVEEGGGECDDLTI
jgi:hypothetical protein